jgi:hypothetical protein
MTKKNYKYEVYLKHGKWPQQKPDFRQITIAQLFRISNSLRSEHRVLAILTTNKFFQENDLVSFQIRYELFLKQSAVLFEALKNIKTIIKEGDQNSKSLAALQKAANRFYAAPDNLYKVIKYIRNKIVFHLDPKIVTFMWSEMEFQKEKTLGIGKSKQKIDFVWSIISDMTLSYISRINDTNKIYALRRDHSVGSRARVSAAEDRGRRAHREVCFCASPRAATTTFFDANRLYRLNK